MNSSVNQVGESCQRNGEHQDMQRRGIPPQLFVDYECVALRTEEVIELQRPIVDAQVSMVC